MKCPFVVIFLEFQMNLGCEAGWLLLRQGRSPSVQMERHQHRSNPSPSATQPAFIEKWQHFLCRNKVLVQTDTTSAPHSSLVCYKHGMERREQKRTESRTSSDVSLVTVKLDTEVCAAIPAFRKLRENCHNLEASLGYAEKPCL